PLCIHPSSMRDMSPLSYFVSCSSPHTALHSFPTRRSSDLTGDAFAHAKALKRGALRGGVCGYLCWHFTVQGDTVVQHLPTNERGDRKSTRLNSSHVKISYAVFCLKKKKSEIKIKRLSVRYL